jgi:hypothetical protein
LILWSGAKMQVQNSRGLRGSLKKTPVKDDEKSNQSSDLSIN